MKFSVAMLLPVLRSARERGKSTTCVNNLKQIGNAGMMYGNDSNGYFLHWRYIVESYSAPLLLTQYLGGASPSQLLSMDRTARMVALPSVFKCPSVDHASVSGGIIPYGFCYNTDAATGYTIPLYKSRRYTFGTVSSTATNTIVAGDVYFLEFGGDSTCLLYKQPVGAYGTIHLRHNSSGNYTFVDGHVKSIQQGEILQISGYSNDYAVFSDGNWRPLLRCFFIGNPPSLVR